MKRYSLSHLEGHELLRALVQIVTNDCDNTALMLAHIAEVDARRLYRAAAHASMFSYCVSELHMSEETAYRRIRAGRAARRFPAIFDLVADGRLNVTAVVLLAPHLVSGNAGELLAAAVHKTRKDIELLLAEHFPQPDVPTLLRRLTPGGPLSSTPGQSETTADATSTPVDPSAVPLSYAQTEPLALAPVVPSNMPIQAGDMEPLASAATSVPAPSPAKLSPLSAERYALQVTLSRTAHDHLREAQALLGHSLPSGDISAVLERALGEMVQRLRKQKFAETARPRPQDSAAHGRHIPAAIRRAVAARDGGRCTFVSARGKRCDETSRLEYDHEVPVALGGETTVANLRLRCRAHNQYAAECVYGAGFMGEKRQQGRRSPMHETGGSA
jgi:hypothetical protein